MKQGKPTIRELRIYPIKSLCAVSLTTANLKLGVGLEHDREWALLDANDFYINGKHCPKVHQIRLLQFEPPSTFQLQFGTGTPKKLDLANQHFEATCWFQQVLEKPNLRLVRRNPALSGFQDDPRFDGPSIVSQATLETVQKWFGVDDAIDRFRPNVIVDNVPAFWEDLLVNEDTSRGLRMLAGSSEIVGAFPIHRCVVPSRSPSTSLKRGEVTADFIPNFQKERKACYPEGAPVKRLQGAKEKNRESYFLCTACIVLNQGTVSVGDVLEVKDSVLLQECMQKTTKLERKTLHKLIDGGYSIRDLPKGLHSFLSLLITCFPVGVSGFIVTRSLPDSVRKPTTMETTMGFVQLFLGLFFIYWLFRKFLSLLP